MTVRSDVDLAGAQPVGPFCGLPRTMLPGGSGGGGIGEGTGEGGGEGGGDGGEEGGGEGGDIGEGERAVVDTLFQLSTGGDMEGSTAASGGGA